MQVGEVIIKIDEIVISANKWEESAGEVPNAIVSIQPKDIRFSNPQTAADALDATGQIFVQKSLIDLFNQNIKTEQLAVY